jgi:SPP1 gp7 family putative phage head morphogenesis protein
MTEAPQAGNRLYRRALAAQGGGVVAAANATPAQAIAANISTAIDNAAASAAALAKSLSDEAQNRINQALLAGKRVGAPAADVARDINVGLKKGRDRAARGAGNEVDNAVKAMTDARMVEANITQAAWRHFTPRERARPTHLARDGQRFDVNDPAWDELMLPFCRCQKRPVLTVVGSKKAG